MTHNFLVTTSNKTSLNLETDKPMTDGAVTYGSQEWVQVKAVALGGRPKPNIKWSVDGKDINSQLYRYDIEYDNDLSHLPVIDAI